MLLNESQRTLVWLRTPDALPEPKQHPNFQKVARVSYLGGLRRIEVLHERHGRKQKKQRTSPAAYGAQFFLGDGDLVKHLQNLDRFSAMAIKRVGSNAFFSMQANTQSIADDDSLALALCLRNGSSQVCPKAKVSMMPSVVYGSIDCCRRRVGGCDACRILYLPREPAG